MMDESVFQHFMKILPEQTLSDLQVLHYLFNVRAESYLCLDLNIEAKSKRELDNKVEDWVNSHEMLDKLDPAPESEWRKLADVSHPVNHNGSGVIKVWQKSLLRTKRRNYQVIMERWDQ